MLANSEQLPRDIAIKFDITEGAVLQDLGDGKDAGESGPMKEGHTGRSTLSISVSRIANIASCSDDFRR